MQKFKLNLDLEVHQIWIDDGFNLKASLPRIKSFIEEDLLTYSREGEITVNFVSPEIRELEFIHKVIDKPNINKVDDIYLIEYLGYTGKGVTLAESFKNLISNILTVT